MNHTPIRLCLCCRQPFERSQLVWLWHNRLNNTQGCGIPHNTETPHPQQHPQGRSAYVCLSKSCLTGALKGTRLQKALKTPPAGDILSILQALAASVS